MTGLALIANTQPGGDGIWFWYARSFLDGKRLYTDLHLSLQPLYVLETATWMKLAGSGWLLSKVPALIHLAALCAALLLLLRESSWPDWQKGILLAAGFLVSIQFVAYRFDDYHVVADTLVLFTMLCLLRLGRTTSVRVAATLAGIAGILAGVVSVTRINDGAALFVAGLVCILVLTQNGKLAAQVRLPSPPLWWRGRRCI